MVYNDDRKEVINGNTDYFKHKNFCNEDLKELFLYALTNTSFPIIQYFVENYNALDWINDNDTTSLLSLAGDKNCLPILKYLEKNGVDLLKIGNGILISHACALDNIDFVDYILKDAPDDLLCIELGLILLTRQISYFTTDTEDLSQLESFYPSIEPLANLLMSKLSSMDAVYYDISSPTIKTFLQNKYLEVHLQDKTQNLFSKRNKL